MKVKRIVLLAVFFRAAFSCAFLCTLTLLMVPAYATAVPAGFVDELVDDGLSRPTAMTIAPDGRIFVCEQGGKLRLIKNGTLWSTPVLSVSVDSIGERGLLGVALDPDFASNQYIYVYYTAVSPTLHNRISRFTLSGDVAVPGSEAILFDLFDLVATNHNGGAIHFGLDGKLYVAVGENAVPNLSQNLGTLHGKMLRLNKDGSIPTDNPFYNTVSGDNRAIWAYGLRNPFTFAVHPVTGRMFINDVGSGLYEEVNDGIAGANYGWPQGEGPTVNPNFVDPIYYYSHAEGCSITGATFFSPQSTDFPAQYQGVYFFADWCSSWIRMLDPGQGNSVTGFATDAGNPVGLDVGPDGNLYYLARGDNAVYRIRYLDCDSQVGCADTNSFRGNSWIKFNLNKESKDKALLRLCMDECFCNALKADPEEVVLQIDDCTDITIPGSKIKSNKKQTKFRADSPDYRLKINCKKGWVRVRLKNADLKNCVSNPVEVCISITNEICICAEDEFEEILNNEEILKKLTLTTTKTCPE